MVYFSEVKDSNGVAGVIHFFVGLMKADGGISVAEIEKIKILIYKFRTRLPGDYETIRELMEKVLEDYDYKDWDGDKHFEKGLEYWNHYFRKGKSDDSQLEAILDILELVGEIDEMSELEQSFIDRVRQNFVERFELSE